MQRTRASSRRLGRIAGLGAVSITASLLSPPALAQDGELQEIVVTATKTGATALQSTPIAITAFSAAQLDTRAITDVRGLVDYTPGLEISDVNGYAQLYLRGVGSNNVYIGSDPSTTIHLDGVYLARPIAYFSDFLDVERIEVLRGPQGTLYGRNSVGGTINIISRKPSDEFTGEIQALVGDYNAYGVKGYVSGPIADSPVRASLSFLRLAHDPYFHNVSTGGDINDQDSWAVRGQIYTPLGEHAELTIRGDYTNLDESLAGASKLLQPIGVPLDDSILGNYHQISANAPNSLREQNFGFAADLKYDISDALSLRSLTAYRSVISHDVTDSDASSLDITRALFDLNEHELSEEVNLNATLGSLTLVAGAYYFSEIDREPANVILPGFGVSHFQRPHLTDESYAFYAQGEYQFTDQISGVLGLRYTREDKDYQLRDFWTFSGSPNPNVGINAPKLVGVPGFSDPFFVAPTKGVGAVTPKFGLNWKPTDKILVYGSITRGFKSGGFDFGATQPSQQSSGYGPEYLWSYEVGVKSQWLENRLRLNLDAFYYDYSDLQVTLYVPPANGFTQNAATAEVKGIEAELMGRPLPSIDLFANIAFLDARYTDYPGAQIKAFGAFDASGKYLDDAPRWAIAVGGSYTYDTETLGSFSIGADFHFQTTEYFSPANDGVNGVTGYPAKQGAFGLLNARVGWTNSDGDWSVMVIGRNLTDRQYITTAADYGGPFLTTIVGRPGNPRTVTAQLTRKF